MIPNAGSAMYIPRFSAITDSPSPNTSDSESAFSMIAKLMTTLESIQPLQLP